MDAISTLKEYKSRIDTALSKFFDEKIKEAGNIDKSAIEVMQNLKEFNLRGGKRIRPTLMIHAYKCFSEPDEKDIIYASLAVELMEGFLLIHDDITDQDDLRRGGPTFHKIYEKKYNFLKRTSPARFGENIAIVAADMQNSLANEIITSSNFSAEILNKIVKKYHEVALKTEYGWLLETMVYAKQASEVTEQEIMKVNEFKTAGYTIEGPLHMGATLAGVDQKELNLLTDFAVPLGIAFQIQDDILGMYGNEAKLGKPIGSDLREGKITLLIVKALGKASEEQKKILLDNLGKQNLTLEDINAVRKIIMDTGSLDYSKRLTEELINKAKNTISDADFRPEGKDFLLGIADFMVQREY